MPLPAIPGTSVGAVSCFPTIRRATAADVPTLSELSAIAFTQAFGHLYAPADLARFLAGAYDQESYAALIADPTKALWVAERSGQVIGYGLAGPCNLPHPEVTEADGEIKRLYLLAGHQGSGVGSILLKTAMSWLLADGPRVLWLGVWSQNHGAQRLYNRHGFTKVGEYEFPVGEHRDREFIFRRPRSQPSVWAYPESFH